MSENPEYGKVHSTVNTLLHTLDATPIELPNGGEMLPLTDLYEDLNSIIAVAHFASAADLINGWLDAQAALARVISRVGVELGPKAWDAYLILITEEPVPKAASAGVAGIRSNTRHARKLVVSADDAHLDPNRSTQQNIATSLAPLLPIVLDRGLTFRDPLATLASRLNVVGLEAGDIDAAISAHRRGLPIVAELHSRLLGRQVTR